MRASVLIVTYRRAWSLPLLFEGLVRQTVQPDEVVVVLKPSGDGSEKIIGEYQNVLPIRLYIQEEGYAIHAYEMAIKKAEGDVLLFIDDDAVPHNEWVERYLRLFEKLKDAGAIGGLTLKGYLVNGRLVTTDDSLFGNEGTRDVFYRRPIPQLSDYCRWISISGYPGSKPCHSPMIKSVLLSGNNMGFRADAIGELSLTELYKRSRKAYAFEFLLAVNAVLRGFNTYHVVDKDIAPLSWHIESHKDSLTRRSKFFDRFWLYYDREKLYFRLRRLGVKLSPLAYIAATLANMRRDPLPKLLSFLYTLSTEVIDSVGKRYNITTMTTAYSSTSSGQ
ncbi:MAG: glycosyltransferase [Thermoproteus sp.]